MKLLKISALAAICALSNTAFAKTFNSIHEPSVTHHSSYYPGLDLGRVTSVKVNTSPMFNDPHREELSSIVISFENADDIEFKNFKQTYEMNKFRAVKNGAWIYKQVAAEVTVASDFNMGAVPLDVKLFVVDQSSNTNNMHSYGLDILTFNAAVEHKVITKPKTMDVESIKYADKRLTFKLQDQSSQPDQIELKTMWLGHGESSIFLNHYATENMVPTAIDIEEVVMPDQPNSKEYSIKVRLKDRHGAYTEETMFYDVRTLLEQAYGPFDMPM